MNIKHAINSQYHAALDMLEHAIQGCPDDLWDSGAYKNRSWNIVIHVLFYTHFYLQPSEADFVPMAGSNIEYRKLGEYSNVDADGKVPDANSKAQLLDYLALCREEADKQIPLLDLDAPSGFEWIPFNKLELQFYNIRHIQQHTGELSERLGAQGEVEVPWVGMKHD